jgi:hypothetical protein
MSETLLRTRDDANRPETATTIPIEQSEALLRALRIALEGV